MKIDVVDSRDRKARKIRADIERKIGKLGRKKKKFLKQQYQIKSYQGSHQMVGEKTKTVNKY